MTFKRLFKYFKPYKKTIFIVSIIVLISSITSIFIPKLIGDIISLIYENIKNKTAPNYNHLYTLLVVTALFYIISAVSNYIENYYMSNICEKAVVSLKKDANQKLSQLSNNFYDKHQKGEILSIINNDIEVTSSFFIQIIPKSISYVATFIGIVIMLFTINTTISFIILVSLPIVMILTKLIMKLSKQKHQQYYQKYGYLNSIIQESYLNHEIISIYNKDKDISNAFKNINKDLAKTNLKASLISSLISPLSSIINYALYIGIIILGSFYFFKGKILIGDIQALIQYTKQISNPINNTLSLLSSLQVSLIASKRVFSLLDEKEEKNEQYKQLNSIESIEFKNVSFAYNEKTIINNLNLKINKKEKIAIIGETGSGKSTIMNLLMRLYKTNEGEILINEESIYDYNLNSYYNKISYIPQNIWLYNDTIINNLKFANFDSDEKEILNTCKKTNCLDIINNLPNGFNEILNEDEQQLSHGEKQLLTLTRALLKKHELLILDEATSNIDSNNELNLQEYIDVISKDKITIIIAHKLSTILKADKIIVLKDGQIKEIGTHASLYKEKGEYYNYLQTL